MQLGCTLRDERLNLISKWLDTIWQIKPKRATVYFSPFFVEVNTPAYRKFRGD
jgi:hypothetical protein